MIDGEQPFEILTHVLLAKLFLCFLYSQILCNFLKQYLQEHSASCSCSFRFQYDNLEDSPINGKPEEQMSKQLGKVSNFINLQLKDGIIMIDKSLDKQLLVQVINDAESFGQQSKKVLIDSFHHAAFDNHIHQFMLIPLRNVHFE